MPVARRTGPLLRRDEARELLLSLGELDFERYSVVGPCLRFEETSRNHLKDLRHRVGQAFLSRRSTPTNFLLWGAPGSGKSYLVGEIARSLPPEVKYLELNMTQQEAGGLQEALEGFLSARAPGLCFLDEVDAKPDQAWPYEVLLPFLEPSAPLDHPVVFCLAGSGGTSLEGFMERLRARPKGTDLLSRIPRGNAFRVDSLGMGDRILVSAVQLLLAGQKEGHRIEEVEKLALYYLAVHPGYASARQLRSRAADCAQRVPGTETRIRYDDLFPAGDPENKRFWTRLGAARAGLEGAFVLLRPGRLWGPGPAAHAPPGSRPPPAREGERFPRVAVLPLTNISPDPKDEYVADGLTEELIAVISRVKGLRVISRTSVAQYRGTIKSIRQIGSELGVDAVLEGSVRKAGDQVRITMQLIEVSTDEHRWAESYDRRLENVFAIQAEVAEATARALRVQLVESEHEALRERPTSSAAAHEAYLRGVQAEQRLVIGMEGAHEDAVRYFEEAIREDPDFSQAHAALANRLLGGAGEIYPFREVVPRVRQLVARALRLDRGLADAHVALGNLSMQVDHDWGLAEREFREAIAVNPSHSAAHFWYGHLLSALQRFEEAQQEFTRTMDLDPLWISAKLNFAEATIRRGDPARGIEVLERLLRQPQSGNWTRGLLAAAYAHLGRSQEARRLVEPLKGATGPMDRSWRALVLAILGDPAEGRGLVRDCEEGTAGGYLSPIRLAQLYAILGEGEKALALLEKEAQEGESALWATYQSPLLDPIRQEPRFVRLLEGMHLPTSPPARVRVG
jgi:TolB-like protein